MATATESSSERIAQHKHFMSVLNLYIAKDEKKLDSMRKWVEDSIVDLDSINEYIEKAWLFFRANYEDAVLRPYHDRGSANQELQVQLMTKEDLHSYKNANPDPLAQMIAEMRSQLALKIEEYDAIKSKMVTEAADADDIAQHKAELVKMKMVDSLKTMLTSIEPVKEKLDYEIMRKKRIMKKLEDAIAGYNQVLNNMKDDMVQLKVKAASPKV